MGSEGRETFTESKSGKEVTRIMTIFGKDDFCCVLGGYQNERRVPLMGNLQTCITLLGHLQT